MQFDKKTYADLFHDLLAEVDEGAIEISVLKK